MKATAWIGLATLVLVGVNAAGSSYDPTGLPYPAQSTSAVWTGSAAYIFGVSGGYGPMHVVKWTPSGGAVLMNATFPEPIGGITAAAWTGSRAYVFGGQGTTKDWASAVWSYDPARDNLTQVAVLPNDVIDAYAVWNGTYVFVLAGGGERPSPEIIRFDPSTNTATVDNAQMTRATDRFVWDGQDAIDIRAASELSPNQDWACNLTGSFPPEDVSDVELWDGHFAYTFGGGDPNYASSAIWRYDPSTGESAEVGNTTTGLRADSGVWTGSEFALFGGWAASGGGEGALTAQISTFTPADLSEPAGGGVGHSCAGPNQSPIQAQANVQQRLVRPPPLPSPTSPEPSPTALAGWGESEANGGVWIATHTSPTSTASQAECFAQTTVQGHC